MSMSINGATSMNAAQAAAQRAREAAQTRAQTATSKAAEALPAAPPTAPAPVDTAQDPTPGAPVSMNSAQVVAGRSQALAERFAAIGTRWTERFAELEAQARESGNDRRADQLAEMSGNIGNRLDGMKDRVVSLLEGISQRLAEKYPAADGEATDAQASAVDETA